MSKEKLLHAEQMMWSVEILLDFFSYISFAARLQQTKFHVSINPFKEFSSVRNRKKSKMAIFLLEKNSLV